MPEESAASDESWLAVAPLAIVPAAIALALLLPGPIAPMAPLETAPPGVWIGFLLAGIAPGATIVIARRVLRDGATRGRVLKPSAGAALGLTWVVALAAMLFGPLILVRGGAVRILAVLAVVGLAVTSGAAIALPRQRAAWGAVVAELLLTLVVFLAAGAPRAPDEEVRSAMLLAPAFGETNLGAIALRRVAHPGGDPDYERHVLEADRRLAVLTSSGAFAAPAMRDWADDASLMRGWLMVVYGASPRLTPGERFAATATAASRYLDFAHDPEASLEPFTMGGPLVRQALAETADVHAPERVRMRIWIAWDAARFFSSLPGDSAGQRDAEETVRAIYRDEKLDLEPPSGDIYLATYTMRRARLIQAGDGAAFLAYFDALANDATLPEPERKAFAHESTFVRAHPEDGYKAVMALLAARYDPDPRAALQAILARWPDSSVAVEAQKDLVSLAGAPTPPDAAATP